MRLTLRTLLAYLDDVLEPAQTKEIGTKISESPKASELIHRIREVMRKRRLAAPEVSGPGSGLDPNNVAEYLDSTLSAENVVEVEQICYDSDVHLAEVAACHQVLTVVLGEPVEIDNRTRERMYALGPQEPALQDAAAVTSGASVSSNGKDSKLQRTGQGTAQSRSSVTSSGSSTGTSTASSRRNEAAFSDSIPDYLKTSGTPWKTILTASVGIVILGVWLGMVLHDHGFFQSQPNSTGNNALSSNSGTNQTSLASSEGTGNTSLTQQAHSTHNRQSQNRVGAIGQSASLGAGITTQPAQTNQSLDPVPPADGRGVTNITGVDPSPPVALPIPEQGGGISNPAAIPNVNANPGNSSTNSSTGTVPQTNTDDSLAKTKKEFIEIPPPNQILNANNIPAPPETKIVYDSTEGVLLHIEKEKSGWFVLPKRTQLSSGEWVVAPYPFLSSFSIAEGKVRLTMLGRYLPEFPFAAKCRRVWTSSASGANCSGAKL